MQTQASLSIRNYLNREQLEMKGHRCTQWIFFSASQIAILVADKKEQEAVGLSIAEPKSGNIFEKGIIELKELLGHFALFGKDYQQTHIVIENPYYTFVPEPLFVSEKLNSYLNLTHKLPRFNGVYQNRFDRKVNVFAVNNIFYQTIKALFPGADIKHYSANLIQSIKAVADKSSKTTLHVNINNQYMDLVYFQNGDFTYHNSFPFETDTDIVYFILSVAEHLNIHNDQLSIVVSGNVNASSSLMSLLKKYVPHVNLMKRSDILTYPSSFRELQDQQYFSIISSILCES